MTDRLTQMLIDAQNEMSGVVGVQLAGTDGRSAAHTLPEDRVNPTAAVSASSLQLARRLADLVGDGDLHEITVRSSEGYVLVYAVDDDWVLTLLTVTSANIARINLACRDLLGQLRDALTEPLAQSA